ncbi:MAG: DMT family transporter [Gammaproteobacteria bacterium]|nr:DMT family transporter [Gammaproteobacteria bacterium]
MSVPAAYLGVILIWSTTSLAIKWSGEGVSFLFGVTGRMVLGAALCVALIKLLRIEFPWHAQARRAYLAASLAIYGSLICVYWGAQFIPSGWIAVLFGLTPLATAVMAAWWLKESAFSPAKLAGMLLGLAGLAVIFSGTFGMGKVMWQGITVVLLAVVLQSASAVWVKCVDAPISSLAVTGGGLVMSLPMYLVTWWLVDGAVPQDVPLRAGWSIVYLALFGSVIGFGLYYYALQRLSAGAIALINLVIPVTALWVGHVWNGEAIYPQVWLGTACILLGLAAHQWGDAVLCRYARR